MVFVARGSMFIYSTIKGPAMAIFLGQFIQGTTALYFDTNTLNINSVNKDRKGIIKHVFSLL